MTILILRRRVVSIFQGGRHHWRTFGEGEIVHGVTVLDCHGQATGLKYSDGEMQLLNLWFAILL